MGIREGPAWSKKRFPEHSCGSRRNRYRFQSGFHIRHFIRKMHQPNHCRNGQPINVPGLLPASTQSSTTAWCCTLLKLTRCDDCALYLVAHGHRKPAHLLADFVPGAAEPQRALLLAFSSFFH